MVCSSLSAKPFTLVIDAGHGGHDAGAVGSFSKEKTINLNVALAFGRYVERNCKDVKVIYTRKTDVFVTLHGRADIANKAKADLFVSIHTNSLPKGRISRGMETYTLGMHRAADNLEVAKRENEVILQEKDYKERYQGFDPNSSESYIIFEFLQDNNMQRSVDLAKLVQKNVCSIANRPNKGVKQAGFLVLRETSMPSCLIELGFISTPDEERLLNNNTSIDNIARGIYNAFVAYKRTYNNTGITYSPEEPSAYPDAGDAAKARKDKTASRDTGSSSKSKRGSKAKASNDAEGYGDAENAVSPIETPQPATTAMPKASIMPILPTIPEASAQPAPPAMTMSGAQQTQPDMPMTGMQQTQPTMPMTGMQQTQPTMPMTGMQQTQPIMPMVSAQPTQPVMTMASMQPAQQAMPRTYIQPAPPAPANNSGITFKVQIFVSDIALKPNDARFKRRRDVDNYQEGGMVKYTIGSSANYNEMEKLRRELDPSFHGCFVIAFKNGNKMNINEAIREWRNGRRQ